MSFYDQTTWYLNDKQWRSIINSTAAINIWEGAVRSGKTFAAITRWLIYISRDAPKGNLLMTGNTRDTIYRNMIQPIEEYYPGAVQYRQGANVAYILGRPVFVIGAHDVGSELRIRGLNLSGALVDELTIIPHNFFKMLTSRLSVPGAKIFATTNPDSPKHWLVTEYIKSPNRATRPNWIKTWHFKMEDNHTLDKEYIDNLKAGYSGLYYKRFILGLWVQAAGAIYDMLDENIHFIKLDKMPLEFDNFYVGVDFAIASVTCFVLVGEVNGTLYVLKEWYYDARVKGKQLTTSDIAKELSKFIGTLPIRKLLIDPSAAALRVELPSIGFPEIDREEDELLIAVNSVKDGINAVGAVLKQNKLFFNDEQCPNGTAEMMGYVWNEKAQALGDDVPVKENDHFCDALRYVIAWITFRTPTYAITHRMR